jgi:hypothetical protein
MEIGVRNQASNLVIPLSHKHSTEKKTLLVIDGERLWRDIKTTVDQIENNDEGLKAYITEQLAGEDNANTALLAFLKHKTIAELVQKVADVVNKSELHDLAAWDDANRKVICGVISEQVTREFLEAYLLERNGRFATKDAYDGFVQAYDKRADTANVQANVELAYQASAVAYVDVAAAVVAVVIAVLALIATHKQRTAQLGMTPALLRNLSTQIMLQVGRLDQSRAV